ncbi:hypothetical protein [Candidatus Phycosocius spiralis]|uniref:Uncharacterized protein n=1 Tax=Candidatus Phycosocius spiralis TaxID=2815099 RepID=A0ABQ4PV72_9PROT|nr:hypothetical protein [Candidatus Phycosocius spiralis]GIU66774.1 hypothetical protein PsB1_0928 [Candidatus Phycosocius spiralis]
MCQQIDTARFLMRPMGMGDLDCLVILANDLRVSAHILRMPYPYHQEDDQEWLS